MKTYIALLRGINVGGHKKILMADLKALFEGLNFKDVKTYIQSGNVVFSSEEKQDFEGIIANAIEAKYGFIVPILVKKASEMNKIIEKCPFFDEKLKNSYFILLQEKPSLTNIDLTVALASSYPNEEFIIMDDCVYIFYSEGAGKAKMGINFFEKKLKVSATARNYRTMVKLIDMAS